MFVLHPLNIAMFCTQCLCNDNMLSLKVSEIMLCSNIDSLLSQNDPLGTVSDHLLQKLQKATYQARKLSGAVLGRLSPKLAFKVFDTQILQIMEYGSEI